MLSTSPRTDNTVILLLSRTTRGQITLFAAAAVAYHLSDDHILLNSFIYMFPRFPNKTRPFLASLTKSWTRGMDDGISLDAVPNQLCSKHNSNESFQKSIMANLFIFCAFTKSGRFPVQNLCFCRVINWRGLGRVMRGIAGRGVTRHMSALTTNRNQFFSSSHLQIVFYIILIYSCERRKFRGNIPNVGGIISKL